MQGRHKKQAIELHAHLGASVNPAILWSIAHREGIRLPSKSYWDFEDMITMSGKEKNKNLDEMHNNFFYWTELIQSSPDAIEESVQSVIGGGYRSANIVMQELRFNPMFRNRGGEKDLDHIIMAAVRGLQQALLEYPKVKAGLILMMDRTLSLRQNSIIVDKAIKYSKWGIVGIDLAGPQRKKFSMKSHAPLFQKARKAGLGITVHTGEEGSLAEMQFVVREIQPDRIGHGFLCLKDKALMNQVREKRIVLESCPTSNLRNGVVSGIPKLRTIFKIFLQQGIRFTINTDGPEMYQTNIQKEQEFLIQNGILKKKHIDQCTKWAREATFIKI